MQTAAINPATARALNQTNRSLLTSTYLESPIPAATMASTQAPISTPALIFIQFIALLLSAQPRCLRLRLEEYDVATHIFRIAFETVVCTGLGALSQWASPRATPYRVERITTTTSTSVAIPTPKAIHAHIFALLELRLAPSMSPTASLEFTCPAYTMAAIPVGRQQKIVTRMAGIR